MNLHTYIHNISFNSSGEALDAFRRLMDMIAGNEETITILRDAVDYEK